MPCLVGTVLGIVLWQAVPRLAKPDLETGTADGKTILRGILEIGVAALVAHGVLAGADSFLAPRDYEERMRMSRSEVKDEMMESEGAPQVKGRLRGLRAAKSKQNLARAMANANVCCHEPDALRRRSPSL